MINPKDYDMIENWTKALLLEEYEKIRPIYKQIKKRLRKMEGNSLFSRNGLLYPPFDLVTDFSTPGKWIKD